MPHYTLVRILILLVLLLAGQALPKTDAAIEADIRARLSRSKIAVNGFQVKVRNGVATWTGSTNVIQHKGAATRMAKSAGATSVDNRIQISAEAKARAAQHLHRGEKTTPRTEHRTEKRSDQPKTEPEQPKAESDTFVPPPVRRAVIKK